MFEPIPFAGYMEIEEIKLKCIVKCCENHKDEGGFNGDVCSPCYQFIAHGKGINSQAYRNANLAKTLTDDEITEVFKNCTKDGILDVNDFARAILRKAQEK